MKDVDAAGDAYKAKKDTLLGISDWDGIPEHSVDNIVRLGIVLDTLIEECSLDAVALRCWLEMQQQLDISPCVLISEMTARNVPVACEVDIGNAVAMAALSLASGKPPTCLDWNNNYEDEDDKCILFHCGPVPHTMMQGKGKVTAHAILQNVFGRECAYGCNTGRIKPGDMTFSSLATDAGRLKFYVGEGKFTDDPIPSDFFGCAGVAEIAKLQDVLLHVGMNGHRHHTSVTAGHVQAPLVEALDRYLGYDVSLPQQEC